MESVGRRRKKGHQPFSQMEGLTVASIAVTALVVGEGAICGGSSALAFSQESYISAIAPSETRKDNVTLKSFFLFSPKQ